MIDRIQARRDQLAAQLDQARGQYDQLEQTLKLLDRQLCAMAGGVQELDALLELHDDPPGDNADDHDDQRADAERIAENDNQ